MLRMLPLAAVAFGLAAPAQAADPGVQIGVLECSLVDKTNLVVIAEASYDCTFTNQNGETAGFTGKIDKFGLDLSVVTDQKLNWLVLAPGLETKAEVLAGSYAGTSAEIQAGGGVGLRVLVGGSDDQITLNPFSTSGQAGIGASFGVELFEVTAK
ncbi:MAG: DUF992 domain-containing protein [Pseudomonadota bacterium]